MVLLSIYLRQFAYMVVLTAFLGSSSAHAKLFCIPAFLQKTTNPQMLIWEARSKGDRAKAEALEDSLAQSLNSSRITEMKPIQATHTTEVYLVKLEGGIKAVWKPQINAFNSNARKEVAAFVFDRLLDLNVVPVTVLRTVDGHLGSLQAFLPGHTLRSDFSHRLSQILNPFAGAKFDVDPRIRFLDLAIEVRDRTKGSFVANNVMVLPNGQQAAIDHGYAFPEEYSRNVVKERNYMRSHVMEYYPGDQVFQRAKQLTYRDYRVLEPYIGDRYLQVFNNVTSLINDFTPNVPTISQTHPSRGTVRVHH